MKINILIISSFFNYFSSYSLYSCTLSPIYHINSSRPPFIPCYVILSLSFSFPSLSPSPIHISSIASSSQFLPALPLSVYPLPSYLLLYPPRPSLISSPPLLLLPPLPILSFSLPLSAYPLPSSSQFLYYPCCPSSIFSPRLFLLFPPLPTPSFSHFFSSSISFFPPEAFR